MNSEYEEILHHPHHVSRKHPQMSMSARAAQFSSFKALTGYEDAIDETASQVDARLEPDDDRSAALDEWLRKIREKEVDVPISVTYFQADEKKSGGVYLTHRGTVRRVDEELQLLVFHDGNRILLRDIYDIFAQP